MDYYFICLHVLHKTHHQKKLYWSTWSFFLLLFLFSILIIIYLIWFLYWITRYTSEYIHILQFRVKFIIFIVFLLFILTQKHQQLRENFKEQNRKHNFFLSMVSSLCGYDRLKVGLRNLRAMVVLRWWWNYKKQFIFVSKQFAWEKFSFPCKLYVV